MANHRRRPFADEQQYYVYAWFYKGECIYAGFGHANRCRDVQYKLAPLLNVIRTKLTQQAIIVVSSCGSRKAAQKQERFWIKQLQPKFCIAPGAGSWPGFLSAEARERIAASKRGRKLSLKTRRKMSTRLLGNKRLLGHVHTAETRAKISVASKGRPASKLCREKARERMIERNRLIRAGVIPPSAKGKKWSAEARQHLSLAKRGIAWR